MFRFVLIHGAYHGGWCWRKIVDVLCEQSVEALAPTLTGLGERSHLLTGDVNLSTHITDIVQVLKFEDLHDVVLVGHSYAGMVISGVAEIIPERIAHLVYLDALVPLDGQTVLDILPGVESRAKEITLAGRKIKVITPPTPQAFGVDDPADVAWVAPRLTPMPYKCYAEPIKITNVATANIPKTYLICDIQLGGDLRQSHESAFERAKEAGWSYKRLAGPHDIMVTHPRELVDILLEIPGSSLRNCN
ncbi:MAG: alpha/beta hydrolase family protein [PVC group bacterium]